MNICLDCGGKGNYRTNSFEEKQGHRCKKCFDKWLKIEHEKAIAEMEAYKKAHKII